MIVFSSSDKFEIKTFFSCLILYSISISIGVKSALIKIDLPFKMIFYNLIMWSLTSLEEKVTTTLFVNLFSFLLNNLTELMITALLSIIEIITFISLLDRILASVKTLSVIIWILPPFFTILAQDNWLSEHETIF